MSIYSTDVCLFHGYQAMSSVLPVFYLRKVKYLQLCNNCHTVNMFANFFISDFGQLLIMTSHIHKFVSWEQYNKYLELFVTYGLGYAVATNCHLTVASNSAPLKL
jgi:hypothetical protein